MPQEPHGVLLDINRNPDDLVFYLPGEKKMFFISRHYLKMWVRCLMKTNSTNSRASCKTIYKHPITNNPPLFLSSPSFL